MFAIHIYAYRIKQISQMRVNATSRPTNKRQQQALASTSSSETVTARAMTTTKGVRFSCQRRRELNFAPNDLGLFFNWLVLGQAYHISAVSSYRQTDGQTDRQRDSPARLPQCLTVTVCSVSVSHSHLMLKFLAFSRSQSDAPESQSGTLHFTWQRPLTIFLGAA